MSGLERERRPEETPIPDWQFAAREEDRIAWRVVTGSNA